MIALNKGLPSALEKKIPIIRETELPPTLQAFIASGSLQPGTRRFRMGKVSILLSPPFSDQGWHMSISRDDRYPDWDEVVAAWYSLVPDAEKRTGVMHLPPLRDYINIHEFCFQVQELLEEKEHAAHN